MPQLAEHSLDLVALIGGPHDDLRLDDVPEQERWIDLDGERYVVRATYAPGEHEPDGRVGIWLPLYADMVRRARSAELEAERRAPAWFGVFGD